ncbi:MAG: shikimate kinase [Myxococcota bacterium]|jgi:shikimate kinase
MVAEQLGRPFVDLDERIGQRASMATDVIFEKLGEAYFRRLEAELLAECLSGEPVVLATGGGALVQDSSRQLALEQGIVVWLRVLPEIAAQRCAASEIRPLLAGDPVARLTTLLEQRQAGYSEAHAVVETDGRPLESVAADLVSAVQWAKVA